MPDVVDLLTTALGRPLVLVLPLVSAAHLSCATDVQPDEPFTVTITPYSVVLIGVGDTCRLNATVRDADGNSVTATTVQWESSSQGVATIDQNGLVTARASGRFVVTATVESLSANRPGTVINVTGTGTESLDRAVASFMDRWGLPSLALAVTKENRLVVARGYGFADVAANEELAPDALFRIASLSKLITAVAIMKLREAGRLRLDELAFDILADLWPDNPAFVGDARTRDVTVRMQLQHSGGWDRDTSFDPMFMSNTIAAEMGIGAPADAETIIRYG